MRSRYTQSDTRFLPSTTDPIRSGIMIHRKRPRTMVAHAATHNAAKNSTLGNLFLVARHSFCMTLYGMETPVEQEPSIKTPLDFLDTHERSARPEIQELQFMIVNLCERKEWTLQHLHYATGIPTATLSAIKNRSICVDTLGVCQMRSLWFLWMADVAPSVLKDYLQIVCWGRLVAPVFEQRDFNAIPLEDRKALIEALEGRQEAGGKQLRLYEVSLLCHVTVEAAEELCRQAAYKVAPEPEERNIPEFLLYGSVWRDVNWSGSNRYIADRLTVSVESVAEKRIQLRLLAKQGVLENLLEEVSADKSRFKIFLEK